MNVIITGAGGLIGSSVYALLKTKGYNALALHRKYHNSLGDIFGDLEDEKFIDTLKDYNPNVIVHCAGALPGVNGNSISTAAKINKLIDNNIINYCKKNNCKLIYISGTAVYKPSINLTSETTVAIPSSEYVLEKYNSEIKIENELTNYIILRVSAPYGPQQKANTVLKIFINQALQNETIQYFGSGNRNQDFTHADDIANAVLLSLNCKHLGKFNIASGKPINMLQLATLIKLMLPESTSKVIASNTIDPEEDYRAFYDITKAKEILHWEPQISLEKGIIEFANHLKTTK